MSSRISDPKHQVSETLPVTDPDVQDRIAAAYDAIAAHYDSQLAPAQWIRTRLWERMDHLFPAGSRILDVTAGTGLDALHLVARGVSVVACDIAPQMLELLRQKKPDIQMVVADFNHLEIRGEFDGMISTFAGLNTSADLRPFAKQAARLIRPNGTLFIHLLNRWPILQIAQQIARFRWRDAWRTMNSNPRKVALGEVLVSHYCYSPNSLYRTVFAPDFRLCHLEGQAFIRPIGDKGGENLKGLERRLASRFPFHSLGVFFSLELTRVR